MGNVQAPSVPVVTLRLATVLCDALAASAASVILPTCADCVVVPPTGVAPTTWSEPRLTDARVTVTPDGALPVTVPLS